jgi:hydroxyacylglutathione hydrolase
MSGGAAVLGAMEAVGDLDLPLNVVALLPATENLPGGDAFKPGDVLTMHSGKTVEIVTTDAEGRLILADALSYARRYEPSAVVDCATLTGACHVALGDYASGLMGNDEDLISEIQTAGEATGERSWPLPLFDEYTEQIRGDVADIKNSGGRYGGALTAGAFLKEFADYPWAHLDIAGTAYGKKGNAYTPKGATGAPARLRVLDGTDAMILEMLTVGPFQENCYIIGDEQTGIGALVDPGDEAARIALAVEQTGLDIGQIIITHAHIDHVGAVAALADEYACPVLMHAEAEPMLQQLPTQAMMMGLRFGKVPTVDRHIEDEEVLEVGGLGLRSLYTPGHAPGHLAFYLEDEGLVLSGDALFAGSVGRTDLFGGNMDLLMRSINERLLTLPDETRVLSGHGPETTIGEERAHNPFLGGELL